MRSAGSHIRRAQFLTGAALLLAVLGLTRPARAGVAFGGLAGYAKGTLTRTEAENFNTVMTQGHLGFEYSGFLIQGFLQTMDFSYEAHGEEFSGIFSSSGLGLGYAAPLSSGSLSLIVQVPVTSAFIILSETSGTVNGSNYINSTLTALEGGTGFQVLTGYQRRVVGNGKRSSENVHAGFYLGYLSQTFATETTRFKTNNSALTPENTDKEKVSHRVTLISVSLGATYDL